jgi:hypothetical protein
MRRCLSLAGVVIVPMLLCSIGHGQSPTPARPPLSPYLNQVRGSNPAVNYFFGVAGQTRRQAVQLGRPQAGPDVGWVSLSHPVTEQAVAPGLGGHHVRFMNCAPYFDLNRPLQTPGNVRRSARQ